MKVFEVLLDYHEDDGTIRRHQEYVTADNDSFELVAKHFTAHCFQYECELVRITNSLTIVQHIKES